MQSLESLVKTIEEKKRVATMKLHDAHPSTRNTLKGNITRAKLDLEDLYRKYRAALKPRVIFILATGSQVNEFVKIAEEEFACFKLDADCLNIFLLNLKIEQKKLTSLDIHRFCSNKNIKNN